MNGPLVVQLRNPFYADLPLDSESTQDSENFPDLIKILHKSVTELVETFASFFEK